MTGVQRPGRWHGTLGTARERREVDLDPPVEPAMVFKQGHHARGHVLGESLRAWGYMEEQEDMPTDDTGKLGVTDGRDSDHGNRRKEITKETFLRTGSCRSERARGRRPGFAFW